ncbi:MAG: methyltransferase family protein [bacterium]
MTGADSDRPNVIALPPLLYGIGFTIALLLDVWGPLKILSAGIAFWLGMAFLALGGALAFWGQRTMRRAGTNVSPSLPTTALVTDGPFRFSRNPLYVALTVLYLGLTLAVNTLWALPVLVPLVATMHYGVIKREEQYLEAKFGDSYRSYRAAVRRWL